VEKKKLAPEEEEREKGKKGKRKEGWKNWEFGLWGGGWWRVECQG